MCVIVGERLCASARKCEYMSVSERKSVSVQRAGRAGPTPLRHRVEAAPGRGVSRMHRAHSTWSLSMNLLSSPMLATDPSLKSLRRDFRLRYPAASVEAPVLGLRRMREAGTSWGADGAHEGAKATG